MRDVIVTETGQPDDPRGWEGQECGVDGRDCGATREAARILKSQSRGRLEVRGVGVLGEC